MHCAWHWLKIMSTVMKKASISKMEMIMMGLIPAHCAWHWLKIMSTMMKKVRMKITIGCNTCALGLALVGEDQLLVERTDWCEHLVVIL